MEAMDGLYHILIAPVESLDQEKHWYTFYQLVALSVQWEIYIKSTSDLVIAQETAVEWPS